jgi:hypothetical protein
MTEADARMSDDRMRFSDDAKAPYLWSFVERANPDHDIVGYYDAVQDVTLSTEAHGQPLILTSPRRLRTNTGTRVVNEGTDWD